MSPSRKQVSVMEKNSTSTANLQDATQLIHEALKGLRFGHLTIVIQDGVIVQIDRTEKRRIV
ncbi:YezD family protein [Planctomicrobium sp. SH664]|uniref:YezD family protein n=1 Tax=Planctomicrobium sp. SH664 TaxID=3448125 RepID=UPI003F5AF0AD